MVFLFKYSRGYMVPMELTDNAIRILEARYLQRNGDGNIIETPEELFQRVANDIAAAELAYNTPKDEILKVEKQFFHLMTQGLFLPNSPTLMNSGTGNGLGYSACYVLPVPDDMTGIFMALKHAALIWQAGGGTGFSFSLLRPKNDIIKTTSGVSSGPVSFMKIFDMASEQIKQGGKRRSANMGIMRIDHPDIREFITSKDAENSILSNFNISVAVTDKFMEALERGDEYALVNPRTNEVVDTVPAQEIFTLMCEQAWKTGDPGLWFIDRANKANPIQDGVPIDATNPCGEQALQPYDVCNLGSINLGKFVIPKELSTFQRRGMPTDELLEDVIDRPGLEKVVKTAVRFLDNVIDRSNYPMPEIAEMAKKNRRIGLGVMGFADMLALLEVPYDSQEALDIAEVVMSWIQEAAEDASMELAEIRGPFPNWKKSVFESLAHPPRNAALTTIAPTGTISRIAGCSSGIEPYYALAYKSNVLDGQVLVDRSWTLEKVFGSEIGEKEWKGIADNEGSVLGYLGFDHSLKQVFKTALEISLLQHIRMQAVFQKIVNNSISKTINMSSSATVDDIYMAYLKAWEMGYRGITIYRDGCKAAQVLETGKKQEPSFMVTPREPRDLPEVLEAKRIRVPTGHGTLFATVTYDETSNPVECFVWMGRSGGCTLSYLEAIGRLTSIALRSGVSVETIIETLRGIRCQHSSIEKGQITLSLPDAVGYALERLTGAKAPSISVGDCPRSECSGKLIFEEGCERCLEPACDYTRCG